MGNVPPKTELHLTIFVAMLMPTAHLLAGPDTEPLWHQAANGWCIMNTTGVNTRQQKQGRDCQSHHEATTLRQYRNLRKPQAAKEDHAAKLDCAAAFVQKESLTGPNAPHLARLLLSNGLKPALNRTRKRSTQPKRAEAAVSKSCADSIASDSAASS
eukprot:6064025-Amphidinium_carterae.1